MRLGLYVELLSHSQRRRRHFKSGQATATKRSLMHVNKDGGVGVSIQQASSATKKQTNLAEKTCTQHSSFQTVVYRERQGLVGSLCKRPTRRNRLRSRTTASSGIHPLKCDTTRQICFADDATAGGKLNNLREWWDCLTNAGPDYGYFPNASKTWLIVKQEYKDEAISTFEGIQVVITEEGKKYLGSATGKQTFIERYVQQKVTTWVDELERLSSIAITQPHAAFAAFTHGLTSRWTYLARTTPNIANLIKPLEETIRKVFLPNLTGQNAFSDTERELLALPARLGELGIFDPSKKSTLHYSVCETISAPLVHLILDQSRVYAPEVKEAQTRMRHNA